MLGASPTRCLDLFAQCFAGTKNAHGGVVGCDSGLAGELLNGDAIDFYPPDRCFVLGLESSSETRDAATDGVMKVRRRFRGPFHLTREELESAIPSPLMPVVIDDGVA